MTRVILAPLLDGVHQLRSDAALQFTTMQYAYRFDTGKELVVNHAYRSWAHQLGVKLTLPRVAAWPWQSAHVRGVAVDLNVGGSFESFTYRWLQKNALELYGWGQPTWATALGSNPEPWHWEYMGKES